MGAVCRAHLGPLGPLSFDAHWQVAHRCVEPVPRRMKREKPRAIWLLNTALAPSLRVPLRSSGSELGGYHKAPQMPFVLLRARRKCHIAAVPQSSVINSRGLLYHVVGAARQPNGNEIKKACPYRLSASALGLHHRPARNRLRSFIVRLQR